MDRQWAYRIPSPREGLEAIAYILRVFDCVGTITDLTVEDLLYRRLRFFASGPLQTIEAALAAVGLG